MLPILVDPESANESGMTYKQLLDEAMTLLAHCGQLTMIELNRPEISVNECLGLATRVIAEQALKIQVIADRENK